MKTLSVLDAVEQAEDASANRDMLADVVLELTDCRMDYFFMKPLKLTKAGFVVEQSAKLGLAGTRQVMGSVIRNIIGRMDIRDDSIQYVVDIVDILFENRVKLGEQHPYLFFTITKLDSHERIFSKNGAAADFASEQGAAGGWARSISRGGAAAMAFKDSRARS